MRDWNFRPFVTILVRMRLRRPIAALSMAVVALQLIVAGSGGACPMGGHPEDAMAGMSMPGMALAESGAPAGDQAPCEHEAADRCLAMAACALSASVPAPALSPEWEVAPAVVVPVRVAVLHSRTQAPEPPPPRA